MGDTEDYMTFDACSFVSALRTVTSCQARSLSDPAVRRKHAQSVLPLCQDVMTLVQSACGPLPLAWEV